MKITTRTTVSLTAAALALGLPFALSGCASAADPAPSQGTSESSQEHSDTVTIEGAWAKATAADMAAGEGMTGVFGEITNHGDADLIITKVTSPAAGLIELHEVVDGKMREIAGDVIVPAGGTLSLVPGGNHIMLMEMPKPILPGDDVEITVTFSDGSTLEITALVKDTSGANESYGDLESGDEHDHDHSGHDSH